MSELQNSSKYVSSMQSYDSFALSFLSIISPISSPYYISIFFLSLFSTRNFHLPHFKWGVNKTLSLYIPDRFRQYGLWERYADLYPNEDLVYTVGTSDYSKDWFFAQVTRFVFCFSFTTSNQCFPMFVVLLKFSPMHAFFPYPGPLNAMSLRKSISNILQCVWIRGGYTI